MRTLVKVGGTQRKYSLLQGQNSNQVRYGLGKLMSDRLFGPIPLVNHLQNHQIILGGHEYKITVISSDKLNLLVNSG